LYAKFYFYVVDFNRVEIYLMFGQSILRLSIICLHHNWYWCVYALFDLLHALDVW